MALNLEIIKNKGMGFFNLFPFFGYLCLILLLLSVPVRKASANTSSNSSKDKSVLIVSSYDPETSQVLLTIASLLDDFKMKGGKASFIIENMNCRTLREAPLWRKRMSDILEKYDTLSLRPSLIILMGQEAWTSYLSQPQEELPNIPVMGGMVSRNVIILPEGDFRVDNWSPQSMDIKTFEKGYNICGGYAYKYDLDSNIKLIKRYYPDTKNIAFISDNSYGGICMLAFVRKEMEKYQEYNFIELDGRQSSIYALVDSIAALPEKTVLLMGTWRMDKDEGYFMHNATYMMKEANPTVPVFTLSTIGMGHWAIGGCMPKYRNIGSDLANQVYLFLKGDSAQIKLETISSGYVFDEVRLKEEHLENIPLPEGAQIKNHVPTFWEANYAIILVTLSIFLILVSAFIVVFYYYIRTKHQKDELERLRNELEIEKNKAEESSRLKTAFLANMSHEIRTPLNAIVGFSNVLIDGGYSVEEQETFFDIIRKNSDLLLHLINDILDVSRLESGRTKFIFEECEIVSICKNVLATSQVARPLPNVKYIFDSRLLEYMAVTDEQRLKQVLINLLSNAGKFTQEGSIKLGFDVDEEKNEMCFSVTDTGCGIPIEKRAAVFERFEKLNEYSQGTGIGLSICKITVERLGGHIWVDPEYNTGTRFMFVLPKKPLIQE